MAETFKSPIESIRSIVKLEGMVNKPTYFLINCEIVNFNANLSLGFKILKAFVLQRPL